MSTQTLGVSPPKSLAPPGEYSNLGGQCVKDPIGIKLRVAGCELVKNSALPASALIEVGTDRRLADPEPLAAMLRACEGAE